MLLVGKVIPIIRLFSKVWMKHELDLQTRSCLSPWQTLQVLLQGLRVRRGKVAECDRCSAEYSIRAVVFFLVSGRLCFGCDVTTYVWSNV
jgi:hypothetical protein